MKRIILSEGKNDTIFLKELLTKKLAIDESKILFFDQNSQSIKKNLKFLEDRYFERLDSEWMPYNLLVKSEGGKTKIVDITLSKLVPLCQKGYNPIMLIDLDNGLMTSFINKFREKLTSRFKSIRLTIESRELHRIDDAVMHSISLFKNADTPDLIGTIYIIGFCRTLEHVTGIGQFIYTDEQKKSMFQAYIKRSQIHEMFNEALDIPTLLM